MSFIYLINNILASNRTCNIGKVVQNKWSFMKLSNGKTCLCFLDKLTVFLQSVFTKITDRRDINFLSSLVKYKILIDNFKIK